MNTEIGDDCCEVDRPFSEWEGPGDSITGVDCEIWPKFEFYVKLTGSIEDYKYKSDNEWSITLYAVPLKYNVDLERYEFDFHNQQPVIFNSTSHWSECRKFKRKRFRKNNSLNYSNSMRFFE